MQQSLFETVGQLLIDGNWHLDALPEDQAFVGAIDGDGISWKVIVRVTDEPEIRRIAVSSYLPNKASSGARKEVAELIARINFGLAVCVWDLEMDDGSLLVYSCLDLMDGELTGAMFKRIFDVNFSTVNEYSFSILSVIYGGLSAADAYASYQAKAQSFLAATQLTDTELSFLGASPEDKNAMEFIRNFQNDQMSPKVAARQVYCSVTDSTRWSKFQDREWPAIFRKWSY